MGRREQGQNSTPSLAEKETTEKSTHGRPRDEKKLAYRERGKAEEQRRRSARRLRAEECGSRSRHGQKREEYTKRRGKLGVNPDRRMRNPTIEIFRPVPGTSRHKYTATTE